MSLKLTVRSRRLVHLRGAGRSSNVPTSTTAFEAKKTGKSRDAVKKAVKKVGNGKRVERQLRR